MNVGHIVECLNSVLSPSADTRNAAEKQLEKFVTMPGYVVALMQIMTSGEVPSPLRLSAAVNFKNAVRMLWGQQPDKATLSQEDKGLVKQNFLELICHVEPRLRGPLSVALRTIVEKEFPEGWPELLPKILEYIRSQERNALFGALFTLRILCKKYEFKPAEGGLREPLYHIVEEVFPILLPLFEALSKAEFTMEIVALQKLICKIFWSCTQFGVPTYFGDASALAPWMQLLLQLFQKPVPQEGQPEDLFEKQKWEPWKLKKWIAHIFSRFFGRYSVPRKSDPPHVQQFGATFCSLYAAGLLKVFMDTMSVIAEGGYLPPRLIAVSITYVSDAMKYGETFKVLKPHMALFLNKVLFPLFCYNEQDDRIWQEDPAEILRKESSLTDDFWDPRIVAMNFVLDLIALRGKSYLPVVAGHAIEVLKNYQQAAPEQRNLREKDGALYVLGNLCAKLIKSKAYKPHLENFLVNHVFPELESPYPFMRARACWAFAQFFEVKFTDEQVFLNALRRVLELMKDKDLPTRVKAALSIRFLCLNPIALEPLKQILPQLLEAYLGLMNEIENDDLVKTLQVIISQYHTEVGPFAVALCQRLVEAFTRLSSDEDDDSSAMAAVECLGAIQTILDSVSCSPDLYKQIEPVLMPLLVDPLLQPDGVEYLEETIKIISFLTFYSESISENLWGLFPLLYRAFDGWAMDWMDNLIIPLDNYISRSTDVFLGDSRYLEMILSMYKKLLTTPGISQVDSGEGAQLIEVVLQNCKGGVDAHIPFIVELAVQKLFSEETTSKALKVLLLEVIANALYYNPLLLLQVLESRGCTNQVFSLWFSLLPMFKRLKDKKLVILGLSSMLSLPIGQLPQAVQSSVKDMISALLHLLQDVEKQKLALNDAGDEDDYDENEDEDSEEEDVYEDDENVDGDAHSIHRLALSAAEYSWRAGDDDDEDDGDVHEVAGVVTSPLDNVDERKFFLEHIHGLSNREPEVYNNLMGALSAEEQTIFRDLVASIQQSEQK
ncbi:putative importin-7 [Balamuthia mandrillaris]